ncbi:MAG TPA: malonate decarboxylase holo-[acyl-carrier-protein] synthase [Casimicrobiaceae bacterium]|jgi:phosphoribosyl-dephospho-CoA transferase|nr:malonate decarboxylase holo-[acyl-carrier-protein] synthase [Casimicrobiaceae bacterium]
MPESCLPPFSRHDLVWIDGQAAAAAVLAASAAQAYRLAQRWIRAGRPLVVSRQPPHCDDARRLAVGLALPLALTRQRFALEIDPCTISRCRPPPPLSSVAPGLPSPWHVALRALCTAAQQIGIEYRVFGSAAWQFWTGLGYLTQRSDIDLLWRPSGESQLAQGVALLDAWERKHGIRADGEILFGEDAVCWREWMHSARSSSVLAKNRRGVSLRLRRDLVEYLASHGAPAPRPVTPIATCV